MRNLLRGEYGYLRVRIREFTDSTLMPGPKRRMVVADVVDKALAGTGYAVVADENDIVTFDEMREAIRGKR